MNSRKIQDFVVKGKEIFVGLEDSKKTWKIAVRCEKMLIHRVSMKAEYSVLIRYLRNKFPECTIHLIYEAGFKGFNLYDRITEDGVDCVVIPPDLFFIVLDKIRYFSENTFCYNCIQEG